MNASYILGCLQILRYQFIFDNVTRSIGNFENCAIISTLIKCVGEVTPSALVSVWSCSFSFFPYTQSVIWNNSWLVFKLTFIVNVWFIPIQVSDSFYYKCGINLNFCFYLSSYVYERVDCLFLGDSLSEIIELKLM